MRRARPRAWALLLAPMLALAACGGDDGGGTQATTPPQPAKVTVTATASGDQVSLDAPAQLKPGATELTLVNNTKEQVEFQIVQLDEGHTLAEFYPALESEEPAPIPEWLHALGGVGEASPGERPQRGRGPEGGELLVVLQHHARAGGGTAAVQAGR